MGSSHEPADRPVSPCAGNDDGLLTTPHPISKSRSRPSSSVAPRTSCPPPAVRRDVPLEIARPEPDRLAELFETAERVVAVLERFAAQAPSGVLGNDSATAVQDVRSIARRAATMCEVCAVEVTCMRQALAEEMIDMDIQSTRVLDHQRMLGDQGRAPEADILARSVASAERVEQTLVALHPHESFAHPMSARVNTTMLAVAAASVG